MDNPCRALILEVMNTDTDIAVIGGGLNGPLLALAMASQGHRVTVIDATAQSVRKNAAFDGRSYAVALTSQRLLAGLGLWDQLADNAQAMLEIKVTDGRAGEGPSPFFMHFDHAEIEEGPMGYMVQDRHLRRALIDAMDASDHITQLSGHAVTGQRAHAAGITLTLDDGKLLTAWSYDQTALVCAIEHDLPHHGIAHQFFMPQGPLAILPLPGNVSSIVWSETDANAHAFNALPDADYIDMLRPRFGDFLGDIRLTGKRWTYPLGLSLTTEMVADRVALIGDAAHGVHPIAGQGLNAGMRDIAALAEVLTDATRPRYQEWRRFDNTALAMATDAFNRLFSNDNPILRIGRDIGMGVIGALPGLRRGAIREAAGLTGDLPRLMQGKPL